MSWLRWLIKYPEADEPLMEGTKAQKKEVRRIMATLSHEEARHVGEVTVYDNDHITPLYKQLGDRPIKDGTVVVGFCDRRSKSIYVSGRGGYYSLEYVLRHEIGHLVFDTSSEFIAALYAALTEDK